ncbi:MAG: ion transporter [Bacteroidales bacterium]|nr:ion transporter [Bacteroidales bacterium]
MKNLTIWERLLFLLSIYVVIELYISSFMVYTEPVKKTLLIIDTIICGLFLIDFTKGLFRSENKARYFRSNWIDLVSSIPMIGILRLGRIVKIIRVLRVVRSGKLFFTLFNRKNSLRSLRNLSVIILCLVILFSISIHQLEKEVNPSLDTLTETFWWTLNTTITFNYYHDISPESIEGRFFSLILVLMGMVLFGTFISFITDFFVSEEDVHQEVKSLNAKIDDLNRKIDALLARNIRNGMDQKDG